MSELERTVYDLDRGDLRGAERHLRHELYENPNAINIVNRIESEPGHARMHVDLFQNGQMRFTQLPEYGNGYGYPRREQVPVVPVPGVGIRIDLGDIFHRHRERDR